MNALPAHKYQNDPERPKLQVLVGHKAVSSSSSRLEKSVNLFALSALATTIVVFIVENWQFWSTRLIIADDARQQVVPWFSAVSPIPFKNDFIFQAMAHYLPPLHNALGFSLSWLIGDPLWAAKVISAIQLALALFFLFKGVRKIASLPEACALGCFFLWQTALIHRTIGGLPRGWAPTIICAFLAALAYGNSALTLLTLLCGCLLYPQASFVCCVAYGIWTTTALFATHDKIKAKRHFIHYLIFAPILVCSVLLVTRPPAEYGSMISLKEAEQSPAFSREGGRFKFLPFESIHGSIVLNAARPLIGRKHSSSSHFFKFTHVLCQHMWQVATAAVLILCLAQLIFRKKKIVPWEASVILVASLICYLAARQFAFFLYVPNRYMLWPLALSILVFVVIGCVNLLCLIPNRIARNIALVSLAALAISCSHFRYRTGEMGMEAKIKPFEEWIANNTAPDSLIAGRTSILDNMPLTIKRRVYTNFETAHPFYSGYFAIISDRIDRSLRALYAPDKNVFISALAGQQIDYFIFTRRHLDPKNKTEVMRADRLFQPFSAQIQNLKKQPNSGAFYRQLKNKSEPSVVYDDGEYLIVDVKRLLANA